MKIVNQDETQIIMLQFDGGGIEIEVETVQSGRMVTFSPQTIVVQSESDRLVSANSVSMYEEDFEAMISGIRKMLAGSSDAKEAFERDHSQAIDKGAA